MKNNSLKSNNMTAMCMMMCDGMQMRASVDVFRVCYKA